jgi:hypothetical protein
MIPNQPLPGENFHPTVRVMRLYKPGFHLSATMPISPVEADIFGSEYVLSTHMLLPDSFGDIYLGEKFSAYVAIVNGFPQVPFYNVSLSVRLQTEATVVELQDIRPTNQIINHQHKASVFPQLNCNDSCDVLIQHTLNEVGTHTLRVSVQYSLFPGGEVKSMRKFYRFNVLMPLIVLSSFREIDHKPMVQCQFTNATKSPIFIEEISFVPSNKYTEFFMLSTKGNKKPVADKNSKINLSTNYDDPLQLLPDESYACAFMFTKYDELVGRIVGYPVIRWCSSMGEASVFRGACPSTVTVGEIFEVSVRLLNSTIAHWPLSIDCSNDYVPATDHYDHHHHHALDTSGAPSRPDRIPHRGLYYVETIAMEIGNLEGGDFTDLVLTVYAACPGLFELPPIYAIHSITKEKYPSGKLCTVLVQNHPDEVERIDMNSSKETSAR